MLEQRIFKRLMAEKVADIWKTEFQIHHIVENYLYALLKRYIIVQPQMTQLTDADVSSVFMS